MIWNKICHYNYIKTHKRWERISFSIRQHKTTYTFSRTDLLNKNHTNTTVTMIMGQRIKKKKAYPSLWRTQPWDGNRVTRHDVYHRRHGPIAISGLFPPQKRISYLIFYLFFLLIIFVTVVFYVCKKYKSVKSAKVYHLAIIQWRLTDVNFLSEMTEWWFARDAQYEQ